MKPKRRDVLRVAAAAALGGGCAGPSGARIVHTTDEKVPTMNTRPLMTLRLATAPTQTIGATPCGERVTFPIIGGTFEGERLRGKVLGGDDWTVRRPDGVIELDLRVTLETDDGAAIHMTFTGVRDDAHAYFRTLPRFETAAPRYAFLNRLLAVGRGEVLADGPVHVLEELL